MNTILNEVSESKAWVSVTRMLELLLPPSLQPWAAFLALIIFGTTSFLAWKICNAIYNLYFHPLAKFPGPREAALSQNWIYKSSLDGRIEPLLEKLHNQYSMSWAI